jgi:hypothetical protein
MVVLSGSMICASSELIPPAVNLGMFNQPFGAKCSSVIFGPTRSQPAQLSLATAATYGLPLFFPALVPIHRPVGRTSKPAGTAMGTNLLDSIGAARGIRTPDPVITNDVLYQLSYCGKPLRPRSAGASGGVALLISGMARNGKDNAGCEDLLDRDGSD